MLGMCFNGFKLTWINVAVELTQWVSLFKPGWFHWKGLMVGDKVKLESWQLWQC